MDKTEKKTVRLCRGDVIEIERCGGLYKHYGIYVGNGKVVHHSGKGGDFGGHITIHKAPVDEFISNGLGEVIVVKYKNRYSRETIAQRAEASVSEKSVYQKKFGGKYNLMRNNCEHFAMWCATGKHESRQVKIAEGTILGKVAGLFIK